MVALKKRHADIIFGAFTLSIILIDQLTKYLVLKFQPAFSSKYLAIHLVKNTGAGFGIFKDQAFVLAIVSLAVAITIIYLYPSFPKTNLVQFSAALFLGGTIGNMIDRITKEYVIDFIDFSFWPAFNMADAAITMGAIGLIIYYWKK